MSTASATCPKCGAALPPEAPAGLCPRCLLEAGLASQSQAGDDSLAAQPTLDHPQGRRFVPLTAAELAPAFPQLEILELLGSGGMGAVYKARQPHLDRLVALKILPPQLAQDPAFEERFGREARALAKLNHPHIVTVYDFGETTAPPHAEPGAPATGKLYYLLMEYVDGTNLRQVIQQGQLKPEEALAIVPQICDALQYAHDRGVVHRDIKPENILLDRQGRVKIADFGLAKIAGQPPAGEAAVVGKAWTLTATGQVMGTPHYMAPEQLRGTHEVDHRADIYSLGVVFYEMLTGELPIGKFEPPSRKVQVDVRLDEVVLRALESNPERRYQQASEVKTDVETISNSALVQRNPSAPPPTLGTEDRDMIEAARRQLRWPAIALTVVGCLAPGLGVAGIIFAVLTRSLGMVAMGVLSILLIESVLGLFLVVSAGRMRALESYGLALVGPILAVIPCASPFYLVRLPIGLWALVTLMKANVRAAFRQIAQSSSNLQTQAEPETGLRWRTAVMKTDVKTISRQRSSQLSAAPAPAGVSSAPTTAVPPSEQFRLLLACAIGMVLGGLMMAAGVALGVYALLSVPVGSGSFWSWMGGALGCFIGGGGSLLGCWNAFRQLAGAGDLLRAPGRTWLDYLMWTYTLTGIGLAGAALVVFFQVEAITPTVQALLTLGGMMVFQGILFLVFRGLMRQPKEKQGP
ncbi:MAG TPA: serine/threonine-protein kinase [Gemmataceae bacterium]|nr:serine/threonine-protein kinase [Gemmataceae bacterium]